MGFLSGRRGYFPSLGAIYNQRALMMAKPLSGKSLVAVARCRGAGHLEIGAGSTAPADLSSEAARCLSGLTLL